MQNLMDYINKMEDPRSGNGRRHKFCDLMVISLLCVLCGGESAVAMENFGKSKEKFLREFLELPFGIPCHDAFSRLFRLINPSNLHIFFEKFCADFAASLKENPAIAIDGKEMRRSFDKAAEQSNLNIVTAFAHDERLSLGIVKGSKGKEIQSLRELVNMLDIDGTTLTADALHCLRETCELIVRKNADYCIQLKANQKSLMEDIQTFIDDEEFDYIDRIDTHEKGHGRIDDRSYRVYKAHDYLEETHRWPQLNAFVHVVSKRTIKGEARCSERIYLFSKCPDAKTAASLIRGHWEIENNLHWSLDVVMGDDNHRARKGHGPENFTILRRIALNIIKANSDKGSNLGKFQRAGWDDEFLKKLILGF